MKCSMRFKKALVLRNCLVIVDADHADGSVAFATKVHDEYVIVENVEFIVRAIVEGCFGKPVIVPAIFIDEAFFCQFVNAVADDGDDFGKLLVGVLDSKDFGRFPEPVADLDGVAAHCPTSSGVRPRSARTSLGIS